MSSRTRNIIISLIALIVVVVVGYLAYSIQSQQTSAADEAAVRANVTQFGAYLKSIQLTEDTELLKRDIQQNYGQFVTDALLQQWRADPTHAPGRLLPNLWPDHIDVNTVTKQAAGYVVTGSVVMESSDTQAGGADVGKIPFVAQLIKENGAWKMAVFQEEQVAPNNSASPTAE